MEAITKYNGNEIIPQDITETLFESFVSYIDRCPKTTRTYLTNLKQFALYLDREGIKRPERQDVINFRDEIAATCKPNTVRAYLRTVKQFFTWTQAAGIYPDIASNIHAPKVSGQTHRKEALNVSEVATIENSILAQAEEKKAAAAGAEKDRAGKLERSTEQGKRLYAIYLLTVNAGLRTVEVHRLNVKDIVKRNGQTMIYIWGKGHTEPDQKKPIAKEVAAAIEDYLKSRTDKYNGSSPLFVSTGNRSGGKRIAETTISTMLKKAMQAAGFDSDRITAHSLRHTAGTAVMEMTNDLYITQKYMRHCSPATTEIYLHNETTMREAATAQNLYNLYHGMPLAAAV